MAGKSAGRTRKKPSAKKTNTGTKTKFAKSFASRGVKKARQGNRDKTPIYALAIMSLLAIIIIMLINNYNTGKKKDDTGFKPRDAKEISAKKDEEKKIKKEAKEEISREEDAGEEKDIKEKTPPDKKEAGQSEFYIYLVRFDQKNGKMSLQPVKRMIKSASPVSGALNELIKGPDKSEKKKGLLTAIPDDLKIRNIQIAGRNAVLNFNDAIETNANGEILLTRIDQIVYTVTQFKDIDRVVIKINGQARKFIGGEGLSIAGPIGRRGK